MATTDRNTRWADELIAQMMGRGSGTATIAPSEVCEVRGADGATLWLERGCIVDGSHWSTEDAITALHSWVNDLITYTRGADRARQLVPMLPAIRDEDHDPDEDRDELAAWIDTADELERLAADELADGWYLELYDNSYFIQWTERVAFEVRRIGAVYDEPTNYFHISAMGPHHRDGEVWPESAAVLWEVSAYDADEDGDPGELVGTMYATWAGGHACYLNLWAAGGTDADDVCAILRGPWVADECEVLHIGEDEDGSRDATLAAARLRGWLQDYADRRDGAGWHHDAAHYGIG